MCSIPSNDRSDETGRARGFPTHAWRALAFACSVLLAAATAGPSARAAEAEAWPKVPPVDVATLKLADFADDELELPYYLVHFHRLANAVVEAGKDRGFIALRVWRNPRDNQPYNARIMENILALAYFYSTDRPWNPYHGSRALRARLEAALEFWCGIQSPQGLFSEYSSGQWNLAATAFATKFMGGTLARLQHAPPLDPALMARVVEADRQAVRAVLTRPELFEHGKSFANQYTNVYAGGLALLAVHPDPELRRLLEGRIREASDLLQSPAGYFYENRGADWGYNLSTHHSNLRMALHYARGTPLAEVLFREERRFVEWLSFNAALEPDDTGFSLNCGIETRQRQAFLPRRRGDPRFVLPPEVAPGAAFLATREEEQQDRAERRARLARDWPRVSELSDDFDSYSPYAFLHREHAPWRPSAAERKAAVAMLPYLRSDRFLHQRTDGREPVVFTYLRRPGYYLAFNSGRRLSEQQRYGIGLLWNPASGSLLQSQTGTSEAAWGTRPEGSSLVIEAGALAAELTVDGRPIPAQPGARDLPPGAARIRYALGDAGSKEVSFEDEAVRVTVSYAGAFREQLPLLASASELRLAPGRVTLRRAGALVSIPFEPASTPEVSEESVNGRRVVTLRLPAKDRLSYSIELAEGGRNGPGEARRP